MWKSKKNVVLVSILMTMIFALTACSDDSTDAGIRIENMDLSAVAGDDFYQYATGGWQKLHPLGAEYARYGSFDKLAEDNREQLKGLIQQIATNPTEEGSIEQKIADLFNMAMDSVRLNQDGMNPIQDELAQIADQGELDQLLGLVPSLMKQGVRPFFRLYVGADPKDSEMNILQSFQGGLGLGERDYYLEQDEHTQMIRREYTLLIEKLFEKAGFTKDEASQNSLDVMRIEKRLAEAAYDKIKLRDPHANYNKMSITELQTMVPEINWESFFSQLGIHELEYLSVSQKEHLIEVGHIIATEPLHALKAYLSWNVLNVAVPYLDDEANQMHFDFYGKILSGKEEQQPRWKRAVSSVETALGQAVGQMYVQKYFPPEAKERMLSLVKNLQTSLGERINDLEWMSETTKANAIEKLHSFHVKIGYPDTWRDYSDLLIEKDSYWANIKRSRAFAADYMFAKIGKPVDKDEWLMTPQTVNAYYNPTTNEICFPAGILQYPFFDMDADDAFNYGAIGVVIGHEMTHGFDDRGRQYDKDGNLKDWWTTSDAEQFNERAQVLVDFFDAIEVAPEVQANGRFTLGENIADHGGLQISFHAFKKILTEQGLPDWEGFSPEQRFFIAYANVWAGNIRPEEVLKRTRTDEHSLGKWRVNGALPHIQAWYDAFQIGTDHYMYLAPENRAYIW